MGIEVKNNVVIVRHAGRGAVEDAKRLCDESLAEVQTLAKAGQRPAILHLSDDLESASEAYARVFAKSFFKIKPYHPVIVAQVDKPVLLAIAKIALVFARTKVAMFRSYDECVAYLRREDYEIGDSADTA